MARSANSGCALNKKKMWLAAKLWPGLSATDVNDGQAQPAVRGRNLATTKHSWLAVARTWPPTKEGDRGVVFFFFKYRVIFVSDDPD